MTALLLAWWLAYPGLAIDGDSRCPTPAQVDEQFGQLVVRREGRPGEPTERHHATLTIAEPVVTITLRASDGNLLAERTLEQGASCAELAQAVAVILAAWEATFSPSVAPIVVSPPALPVSAPPPVSVPAPPPPPKTAAAANVEPVGTRPFTFDAGLGVLTSIAGEEAVFGAKFDGAAFPFARPIGLASTFSWVANHTQPTTLSKVDAQWMRAALSFGPNARWRGKSAAMLDVHAGAVLAMLLVKGVGGLSKTASDTSVQGGLTAGLRGLWTFGTRAVWLGADLYAYPGEDGLTIGNYGAVGRLPRLEVQLAFGISLGRFR